MNVFNKYLVLSLVFVFGQLGLFAQAIHSWTDTQGRTLQASFVKLEGTFLTIRMNGKDFPLDLSYFSPQSQNLARQLAASVAPVAAPAPSVSSTPTPARPALASGSSKPVEKPALPKILTDDSALEAEYEWKSVDDRTLYATFHPWMTKI